PELAAGAASAYLTLLGDQLALCPQSALWIDAQAFEAALADARRTRDPAEYERAVALYTGDLLPEALYDDDAVADRRTALRREHMAALFELAQLAAQRGEPAAAIAPLRRLLT